MNYTPPLDDSLFTLKHIVDYDRLHRAGLFAEADEGLIGDILAEGGRFAAREILPTDGIGETDPPRLTESGVQVPAALKDVYQRWQRAGWNNLGLPRPDGELTDVLPWVIGAAAQEYWQSANISLGVCFLLNQAAARALLRHGDAELKQTWLPALLTGEWCGAMHLTEPQAGSDVGALRSRAEPRDDGSWNLFGGKIYISYGEHDMTENIIHMVLARLPDAPAGTRGISLFMVPRYRRDGKGGWVGNGLRCVGLEKKLGLHASPTCVMRYNEEGEETIGYLVGEAHCGMKAMFTMMNAARIMVGIQGVGLAERAYQQARHYALERQQGRVVGGKGSAMIIAHPDIRRILLTMKTMISAGRALCFDAAITADLADHAGDATQRAQAQERLSLLTPIAKALCSDWAVEAATLGVQVHGGMGYIEETGAAKLLRDAQILPIYEGTNGIQAIDLVMRRLVDADGAIAKVVQEEIAAMAATARECLNTNAEPFPLIGERLEHAVEALDRATKCLVDWLGKGETSSVLAGATPYLTLFGTTLGGAFMARGALAAQRSDLNGGDHDAEAGFLRDPIGGGLFYAQHRLARADGLAQAVTAGAATVGF